MEIKNANYSKRIELPVLALTSGFDECSKHFLGSFVFCFVFSLFVAKNASAS